MTYEIDPILRLAFCASEKIDNNELFKRCKEFLLNNKGFTIVTIHDPSDPLTKVELYKNRGFWFSSATQTEEKSVFNVTTKVLQYYAMMLKE